MDFPVVDNHRQYFSSAIDSVHHLVYSAFHLHYDCDFVIPVIFLLSKSLVHSVDFAKTLGVSPSVSLYCRRKHLDFPDWSFPLPIRISDFRSCIHYHRPSRLFADTTSACSKKEKIVPSIFLKSDESLDLRKKRPPGDGLTFHHSC